MVLFAETERDLQEMRNEENIIGKTFDMKMDAKKTKKDVNLTKFILKIDGDIKNKLTNIPIWAKL